MKEWCVVQYVTRGMMQLRYGPQAERAAIGAPRAAGIYEIEIGHMSQLQKIIKSLQKIKGIRSVERLRGNL